MNERLAIARLKRRSNESLGDPNEGQEVATVPMRNHMNERSNGNSVNDVSITTGSTVQATQGQVEMPYYAVQDGAGATQ